MELGRNILFCLGKNLHELRCGLAILVREEGVGDTLGTSTASTSNSVDVVLDGVDAGGHIVINDGPNFLHVKATGSNIGSNEQPQRPVLKSANDLSALPLRSVPMKRIDGKSFVPELIGKLMAVNLLGDENNDLSVLLTAKVNGSSTTRGSTGFLVALVHALVNKLAQDFLELVLLLILPNHVDMLLDILIGNQGIDFTNIDLNGILQEIMGEPLDLLGPRGRKEKSLPLFRDLCHNGTDLWLETHVQHSIWS